MAENPRPPDEQKIIDMIDDVQRAVMNLYGGNLDHPALDALEHAAWEVRKVAANMASRP